MPQPRLFLIDSYGFIFRAYHARAKSGAPPMRTSAGLSTEAVFLFHNIVGRILKQYRPEYIAAIFESGAPTLREQSFADYKANRTAMPPDLKDQIPYIRRLLDALRIPILSSEGHEADDVIGTIACRGQQHGVDVVILSSDKDLLQLVDEHVSMLNPMKDDTLYDPAKAEEFMGVPPKRIPDLLALKGDAVDNIPGAPGIGDKGAKDLINQYGTVEEVLAHAAEVTKKTYRDSLLNHREQILMSKRLATVECDAPLDWSLPALQIQEPDVTALKALFRELEFFSLSRDLGPVEESHETKNYRALNSAGEIQEFLQAVPAGTPLAVALHDAGKGLSLPLVGLAHEPGVARSVSLEHIESLRPVLENSQQPKVTHDLKALETLLRQHGILPHGFTHDVMLYAFLLTSDSSVSTLDGLAERQLDRKLKGGADESADVILELYNRLGPEVQARGLQHLYDQIDRPLVPVLLAMEQLGIRVETAQLQVLSQRMDAEMQRLATDIYALAGKPFNINSPQQLGKVLYEDLALPAPVKFGKGKSMSTAADILESLAETFPIAGLVLEYRQLAKLKGTYVDALPALLDAEGRVHTTLNMTVATTGRLSSSNPNLQNIPIRTELGREIRAAFVPIPGWRILAADYSQIELRLMAHMSADPVLIDAFQKNQDIHTRTAAEVFHIPQEAVTGDMRRMAKTVNFGIVYGQTPFGLAKQLGIDRRTAEEYIERYFQTYAGVRRYIDDTIATARQTGSCRTIFGRERQIPDMLSRNMNARIFAERTAVNSPLQGTAADLIKLAMIHIQDGLAQLGMQSRMLLQVHDELLFEGPPEEMESLTKFVKHQMESVHELSVPLLVEIGVGENWRDAK